MRVQFKLKLKLKQSCPLPFKCRRSES